MPNPHLSEELRFAKVNWRFRAVYLTFVFLLTIVFVFIPDIVKAKESSDTPWNYRSPLPTANTLFRADYIHGKFFASGMNGTMLSSTDGENWDTYDLGNTDSLRGFAYGNNTYVIVGYASGVLGTIYTSVDGINWNQAATTPDHQLMDIVYGDNKFVAVGQSGKIFTSSDGSIWEKKLVSEIENNLNSITYANGIYVAVGSNGCIFTSLDGESWTARGSTSYDLWDVTYGDGKFVAVGGKYGTYEPSRIYTSLNGEAWTACSLPSDYSRLNGVTYDGNQFVAVGYSSLGTNAYVLKSANGTTWSVVNTGIKGSFNGIAAGNGILAAVGAFGNLYTSTDAQNWISLNSGTKHTLNGIAYHDNTFVSVGEDGAVQTSPDGVAWTIQNSGTAKDLKAINYLDDGFIAVGEKGEILTSNNGLAWIRKSLGFSVPLLDIAYGNEMYVAVGGSGYSAVIVTSTDGVTWNTVSHGYSVPLMSVAYGNGVFVALGKNGQVYRSSDGSSWPQTMLPGSGHYPTDIIYADGKFFGVGYGEVYSSVDDGVTWTVTDSSIDYSLNSIAYSGGNLVAVGQFGKIVASNDNGESWVEQSSGLWGEYTELFDVVASTNSVGNNTFVVVGKNGILLQSDPIVNQGEVDNLPPTWPENSNLTVADVTDTSLVLSWDAANDNVGVIGYKVFKNGEELIILAGDISSYTVTGLASETNYTFKIEAGDAAGNWSTNGPEKAVSQSPLAIWTSRDAGRTEDLFDITWSNGTFMVVGQDGTVLKSPDGVNWSSQTLQVSGESRDLLGVAYGNNRFVTVGPQFYAMTEDEQNWNSSLAINMVDFKSVAYGIEGTQNNQRQVFIASGMTNGADGNEEGWGRFSASENGINWGVMEVNNRESINDISYNTNNGFFAGVTDTKIIIFNSLGIYTTQVFTDSLTGIACNNETYVAIGVGGKLSESGIIYTSTDRVTWNKVKTTTDPLLGVSYGEGMFIAVGKFGTVLSSIDGTNWIQFNSGVTEDLYGVAFGNDSVVLVGQGGTILQSQALTQPSISQKLSKVKTPTWNQNTTEWEAVANAEAYDVKLYKGGNVVDTHTVNEGIGQYDFTQIITDLGAGTYSVTVQAKGNGAPYYDGAVSYPRIRVVLVRVTGVTLQPSELRMSLGQTVQLNAIIEPANATNKNVAWLLLDEQEQLSVDVDGNVTALTPGQATITVRTEDGEYEAACQVEVTSGDTLIPIITVLPEGNAVIGQEIQVSGASSYANEEGQEIVLYEWDFDEDGNFEAQGVNQTHTYHSTGQYSIELRITDNFGVTKETSVSVEVQEAGLPPVASFTIIQQTAEGTVSVDAYSSSHPDVNRHIVLFEWDWNPEYVSIDSFIFTIDDTGETQQHLFSQIGSYKVALRVTDDAGLQSIAVKTVIIKALRGPTADAGGPYEILWEQDASLDGRASTDPDRSMGDSIVKYEWDFNGNGLYLALGDSPTVLWSDIHSLLMQKYSSVIDTNTTFILQIRIKVTDTTGRFHTDVTTLTIRRDPGQNQGDDTLIPLITVSPEGNVVIGQEIQLSGASSYVINDEGGTIVLYEWDFDGDGIYEAQGINQTHTFQSTGQYDIELRITDNLGITNKTSVRVEVQEVALPPAAIFRIISQTAGTVSVDASLSYHPDSRQIVLYEWDWNLEYGSNNMFTPEAVGVTQQHSYSQMGSYQVALRVTDDVGLQCIALKSVTIEANNSPLANAGGPYEILWGQDASFDGSTSTDPDISMGDSIVKYEWDMNHNGLYSDATGPNPTLLWGAIHSLLIQNYSSVIDTQTTFVLPIRIRVTDRTGRSHADGTSLTIRKSQNQNSGDGGSSDSGGSTSTSTTDIVAGDVIDSKTGQIVKGMEAKVTTETNGMKTVEVKSQEAILMQQSNGQQSPVSDLSKLGFSATPNSAVQITLATDGTIQITNLANATESTFAVTYDLGNGQIITIGTIEVEVDSNGEVSISSTLIDPYGIITDPTTGKVIAGTHVTLYYADTERNRSTGKTPDTVVDLPILDGFQPNDNRNPQESDEYGAYAFMVFPTSDYYLQATKDGYETYKSITISVEQEIVKWDFKMNKPLTGITRLAGMSRVDTALAIAKANYTDKLSNVVLATAANYPDALSGSVLAYKLNAPILLVGSSIVDQEKILDYLKTSLNTDGTVYILGGTGAVGSEMETKISAAGFSKINRIGGADRSSTALMIADQLEIRTGTPLVLVNEASYADALAIGSSAAAMQSPILLIGKDGLSQNVKKKITQIKPIKVYIIGLEAVISEEAESQVAEITSLEQGNIVRIGGQDRYATALAVAKYFNLSGKNACVATGSNFPDGLSGSVYAANYNSPIILVNERLSNETKDYLKTREMTGVTIFGGEGAMSVVVEQELSALLIEE